MFHKKEYYSLEQLNSNLRYGKKDATEEDIIKAAKIAQA